MSEDVSCDCGKDFTLFYECQIIDLHQAKTTTMETIEILKNRVKN